MATKTYKVVIDVESQDVEKLEQQLKGVSKQVEVLDNEVAGLAVEDKFKAATGGIKVMTGALAGAVGTLGLLGVESEAFGDFEKKAASAIAIAIGFKDVTEGITEFSEVTKKAGGIVKMFGVTTKQALIATGIGAFVVAIGLVIAYWEDLVELVEGTNRKLQAQNKLLEDQIATGDTNLEILRLQQQAVALRGGDETKITAETKKQLLQQQEANQLLLENYQIQIERERAANREVTLWEKIKIGAAGALGIQLQAMALASAYNSENDKTLELQEKINEAKKRAAQIDVSLAQIEKDANDTRVRNFEERKKKEDEAKAETMANEKEAFDFLKMLKDQELDFLAKTDEEKLKLQYERIQAEIDQLKVGEDEKNAIRLQAEQNYALELQAIKDAQALVEKEKLDAQMSELQDIVTEYRIANIQDLFERSQEELRIDEEKEIARVTALGATEAQIAEIKRYFANQQALIVKEQSEWEMMNAEAKKAFLVEAAAQTFANLSTIMGKESKAGKAAAIAEAIIRTYQAANAAYASLAVIPIVGPALGAIAAAAAVAAGIANVKKIKATKLPGGDSGGPAIPSSSSMGAGAPRMTSMQPTNAPQQAPVQPTVRAYVLSGDARSAQEADAKLNAKRSLG